MLPAARFYTKLYQEPFAFEETVEYVRSVFGLSPEHCTIIAAWLHEKTLGHPYFLAFICKYISNSASPLRQAGQRNSNRFGHPLSINWPVRNVDLMPRNSAEKNLNSYTNLPTLAKGNSQLTTSLEDSKRNTSRVWQKRGLLIRTGRGKYKLYHPLFREFLRQAK